MYLAKCNVHVTALILKFLNGNWKQFDKKVKELYLIAVS